jgi:hypothetical protein
MTPSDRLYESTVRLEQDGHLGTGFLAAPGMVLTAAHVVDGCASVDVVWRGVRVASHAIHRLVEAPAAGNYQWPDVAIVEVAIDNDVWVRLSESAPAVGAKFQVWAYASQYQGAPVAGTSITVEYTGPAEIDGGELLRMRDDLIVPGMSGSAVLDLGTGGVCGVMKSTVTDSTPPHGYATALAGVLALDHEAVARLNAARHAPVWDALARRAARLLQDTGCAAALALALEVSGDALVEALFESDLDTFSLALEQLLDAGTLRSADAVALFEVVAGCLPVDEEALGAWIPAEAADALHVELAGEDPRVAHVPTDQTATMRMLVRRASLELFGQDAHPVQTPEPDAWFAEVERIVRGAAHAGEGWWRKEPIRARARKRIRDKGLVLPLPPLAQPADLDDVRAKLGTYPFVLGGRGPSPDTPRVVRIEPEISADAEDLALYYHGTIQRT